MTETTCTTAAGLELVRLSDHVGGTKGALIRVQAEMLDRQLVDTLNALEKLQAFVDAASVPPAAQLDPATTPAAGSPASSDDALSLARVVRMSSLILANNSFHTVEMLQMATNIERLRASLEAMQGTDLALVQNAHDMVSALQSMNDKVDALHAQIQALVAGTANDNSLSTMADLADSLRSDMDSLATSSADNLKRAQSLGTPDVPAPDTSSTPTPPASTSSTDSTMPTSAPVDSSSTSGSTTPADASTGPTGAEVGSTTTTGTSADAGTVPAIVSPFGSAEG